MIRLGRRVASDRRNYAERALMRGPRRREAANRGLLVDITLRK